MTPSCRALVATTSQLVRVAEDRRGSALMEAVVSGQEGVVRALLLSGVSANVKGQSGFTPLHAAASLGAERIIRAFCAAGAELEALALGVFTPITFGVLNGHGAAVKVLVEAGARLDRKIVLDKDLLDRLSKLKSAYAICAVFDGDEGLEILGLRGGFAVLYACREGRREGVGGGFAMLQVASACGHLDVMTELIRAGASLDGGGEEGRGETSFLLSIQFEQVEAVKILLNAGAALSTGLPLSEAALRGHVEIVKLLLKRESRYERA